MKISWNYKELLLIVIGWLLVFACDPVYMYYNKVFSGLDFSWAKIFVMWGYTLAFLILFILHHYIFIPKLIVKKHYWIYGVCVFVCIALFTTFLVTKTPPEHSSDDFVRHHAVRPLLSPPDLGRLATALLMIGVDLGAVAWFNEQKLKQQLLQLEKQNLKQELVQLRYQINPHFFMNTLNNIHALVDIDQERAKRAIVELSGMMRYTLYEGNESMAPLQHEIEFLKLYISLMRLRFSNKIELYFDMPENTPSNVTIPPLLLTTFVENAFKHGISYQRLSYISIKLTLEDNMIHFLCENSRQPNSNANNQEPHGIGLANVHKRLELLYGNRYRLKIDEHDDTRFFVDLQLPINN